MPKEYINIVNGRELRLSDDAYQGNLIMPSLFEIEFLNNCEWVESYTKERVTSSTYIFSVKYKNIDACAHILYGPLKNSGSSSPHKRIQVSSGVPFFYSGDYFIIGGYNTIDSHMYFAALQGINGFIRRARAGSSYSSFWFSFNNILETYQSRANENKWEDTLGRTRVGCKKENLNIIHEAIINQLKMSSPDTEFCSAVAEPDSNFLLLDFSNEILNYRDTDVLPRRKEFRDIALRRENYTCELCGTHETFIDRNEEPYFEGHHLIMYNPTVQRRFKYCLDHPDNIICLCPNCHSRIHNSSESETGRMLVDLFSKHKDLRSEFEVNDLKKILNDYIKK